MYKMSDLTKKNIERAVGLNIDQLKAMTPAEERKWIEKKTGRVLTFSNKRRHGIIGRGNALLARKKIRRMVDLDEKSKHLFGI